MTEPNSFGHPVIGIAFLIVSRNGDRISVRTNDAGVATAWMPPGSYRVVNPNPVEWAKRAYTWDLVTLVKAGMAAIRLSQENASRVNPVGEVPSKPSQVGAPVYLPASERVKAAPGRRGFWFNLGLGYGYLCSKDCDGAEGGFSGNLAVGGTLTPRFLLGVGTTGWIKSEQGTTTTVGTLDARLRFYPSTTGNFFLTGGVGVGSISLDVSGYGSDAETGLGLMLGLGYDLRVGRNVSVTPFWNGFAIQTSNADANVGQIGVGITVH